MKKLPRNIDWILAALLLSVAIICALIVAGITQAQTACTPQTCTVSLHSVSGHVAVSGCGNRVSRPGRMRVELSTTNPAVTREDFLPKTYSIYPESEHRTSTFGDYEWRKPGDSSWTPAAGIGYIISGYRPDKIGTNIIEVRPAAGARVWSTSGVPGRQYNPGQLVVQLFEIRTASMNTGMGHNQAYFLFTGGEGCS